MVNVLIALNTRMQLPMCNIANVLLLMLMLLKRVIWIFDICTYIRMASRRQQCYTMVTAYCMHKCIFQCCGKGISNISGLKLKLPFGFNQRCNFIRASKLSYGFFTKSSMFICKRKATMYLMLCMSFGLDFNSNVNY